jgi:hypothetical protein
MQQEWKQGFAPALASVLAALLLASCQTASAPTAPAVSSGPDATSMRSACAARVAQEYGVTQQKVELPPEFGIGDNGNNVLNGQVDKGAEGMKEFRCTYDASSNLVDVIATTPDGA